jgi:glycosyltransferase involved in cell wall biosynthesis
MPVKIGVLTTSYPRAPDDSAGGFVAGFARWLAAHAGDVDVVHASAERPFFYRGGAPLALAGGRYAEAVGFSARLLLEAKLRARAWDAIVSHWLLPSGAVGLACALGRRHLAIAHGSDVRLLSSLPLGRALVRRLARSSDLVYVARDLVIDRAPGRVVPMAIDVAPIAAATTPSARIAARARLDLSGFCVLFLGRLIRDKGCDLVIDALPENATLLIAGDGPERDDLLRRACEKRVRFFGHVGGADKLALLAAADALAIPSRVDGTPTVAFEGLAAGLPIVATRAGGLPEILDASTAIFCEPTAVTFHAALGRLARDPARQGAMAASARAVSPQHDWSMVGPRLWSAPTTQGNGCIHTFAV